MENKSEIILCQADDGSTKIDVRLQDKSATCKDFLQVQNESKRQVEHQQQFHNPGEVISVGYRLKNHIKC